MAKPLRPKRGTTAKNDAFTGLASEITIDTDKHSIRVHDGVTAGGHEILPKTKNDELYEVKGTTLPLAGGTMTGTDIEFSGDGTISSGSSSNQIAIRNGSSASQGAGIWLYGNDNSGEGKARIQVYDKANSKYRAFDIRPDGAVVWDGQDVITSSHVTLTGTIHTSNATSLRSTTDDSSVGFYGGTAYNKGAYIKLFGKDSTDAGKLTLNAHDGTNNKGLILSPDGTLTWGGKEVERVNSKASKYIRYENGLQICWGFVNTDSTSKNTTVTYPVAFTSSGDIMTVCAPASGSAGYMVSTSDQTTTSFSVGTYTANTTRKSGVGVRWIAIGWWK